MSLIRLLGAIALCAAPGTTPAETIAPPPPLVAPGSGELGAGGMPAPDPSLFSGALWEDGLAEVSRFDLTQFRYGRMHPGEAVLVVVREAMDAERAVKAGHTAGATVPVLKAHLVKSFQTGVYRYDQAVTTLLRRSDGVPLRLLIDSHEWCGIAAKDWVNRGPGSQLRVMSYFDGHGDFEQPLALPERGVLEDALPVWLRGCDLAADQPQGEILVVPTQLEARAQATEPVPVTVVGRRRLQAAVPGGTFAAIEITLEARGEPPAGDGVAWPQGAKRRWTATYELAPPRRLLRWRDGAGTELALRSVERTDYWVHHRPEDAPKR